MSNSFYIPIHSMNLAHYLGSGIIAPSIYIENNNADIQDGLRNYLLLSSSKFTKDTNCAIEIVLNTEEEAPKKISENFYLFDKPLPISRIKGIYFTNEEKKISSNFDITSGSAFIPEGLLKVSMEESIDTKELENIEYQPSERNWTNFLKRYDQILGGFSTMKISKENFQNYPTHYFSTLGNINNLFTNILDKQNISIENSFQFAFTNEGKFKDFHNTIYSEIDYSEVQRYAENDKVKLEVKNGLVQIDKISENTQTYLVAILESYGKGKRKQVDSFISDLISGKFNEKKKEGLSLIFGLNKGYKAFRNKYKTSNFEVDIKFQLNSKLDYYIIESIYQNIFNNLDNIRYFPYIDEWLITSKQAEAVNPSYVTYQMVDKTIIWKAKVLSPIESLLNNIVQKVCSWFPSFIQVKKNEIELIFKESIELFVKENNDDITKQLNAELNQTRVTLKQFKAEIKERESIIIKLEAENKSLQNSFNELKNKIDSQEKQNANENTVISDEILKTEKLTTDNQLDDEINNENKQEQKDELVSLYEIKSEPLLVQEPVKSKSIINHTNNGSLFENDSSFQTNFREIELNKKSMNDLREIAKDYKIQKCSAMKKEVLIDTILKYEIQQ